MLSGVVHGSGPTRISDKRQPAAHEQIEGSQLTGVVHTQSQPASRIVHVYVQRHLQCLSSGLQQTAVSST